MSSDRGSYRKLFIYERGFFTNFSQLSTNWWSVCPEYIPGIHRVRSMKRSQIMFIGHRELSQASIARSAPTSGCVRPLWSLYGETDSAQLNNFANFQNPWFSESVITKLAPIVFSALEWLFIVDILEFGQTLCLKVPQIIRENNYYLHWDSPKWRGQSFRRPGQFAWLFALLLDCILASRPCTTYA